MSPDGLAESSRSWKPVLDPDRFRAHSARRVFQPIRHLFGPWASSGTRGIGGAGECCSAILTQAPVSRGSSAIHLQVGLLACSSLRFATAIALTAPSPDADPSGVLLW